LTTVLAAIPVRKPITAQIDGKTFEAATGREAWDFDKWQKEDPRGFEALAEQNPEAFQELLTKKHKK
jgi:ATP-dependent Clp protease, protease subunit